MARRSFQEGCVFKHGRRKKLRSDVRVNPKYLGRFRNCPEAMPKNGFESGSATATSGKAVQQTLRSRFSRRGGSRRYFRRTRTQRDRKLKQLPEHARENLLRKFNIQACPKETLWQRYYNAGVIYSPRSMFSRHFVKSPETIAPEEIRSYQLYLSTKRMLRRRRSRSPFPLCGSSRP